MFSPNPLIATLLAFGVTLGLIWLAAKAVTLFSRNARLPGLMARRPPPDAPVFVVESVTAIAPRRRVIVLRYGEQRLAVLNGGESDVSLGWLPPPSSSP